MSNSVTITGNNEQFSGKLVLTNYGKTRILQRVAEDVNFTDFNFTSVGLGRKLNTTYNSNITVMGDEVISFPISDKNVTLKGNMALIETNLDIENELTMQEIGLYETINNERKLFAYASGFSMTKTKKVTYDLIIDLTLSLTFQNEHYNKYNVALDESEYALAPKINNMFSSLAHFQLDFERCVELNARELGYNKAQAFMLQHQENINTLKNILLLGRYEKVINRLGTDSLTDCFYYPSEKPLNYSIINLKDSSENKYEDVSKNIYTLVDDISKRYFLDVDGNKYDVSYKNGKIGIYNSKGAFVILTSLPASEMQVSGNLQICNRDNIDLSKTMSLVYTTKLNLFSKESIVLGKINPNEDEYYFDLRIIYDKDRKDYGLQYTIYSYDYDSYRKKDYTDERKLVGHYRVKYFPTAKEKTAITTNETMFTFVYNGNIEHPNINMYVNTKLVSNSENFIVDNFNYIGPCKYFKETSTLRNYSQTVTTTDFEKPMYYLIPEVDNSSILVFNKELNASDIFYLSLISQS